MANFYQIRRYIQKREEIGRKGEIRRDPSKLGLSLLNREGCQVWIQWTHLGEYHSGFFQDSVVYSQD